MGVVGDGDVRVVGVVIVMGWGFGVQVLVEVVFIFCHGGVEAFGVENVFLGFVEEVWADFSA